MAAKKSPKKSSPKGGKGSENGYSAKDIFVLEGLEPVRKRPGMYIGSTGEDGLHHLVWEIFDNARDEAMGGFASTVEVTLLPKNIVRVGDNGRGIPVDIHKQTKVSALETIMTTLHAGGKFGGESYKIAGGLHGVGASVVNALSTWLRTEVYKEDEGKYVQEYERGKPKAKVKRVGPARMTGTVVTFTPDPQIFKEIAFDWHRIVNHLREQAYLVKGLKVVIIDARDYEAEIKGEDLLFLHDLKLPVESYAFYFEGGVRSLVSYLNRGDKPIHDNVFYVEKEKDDITVEVALQYVEDMDVKEMSFANNIKTPEGGMHLTGLRTALTRTVNDYAKKNNLAKGEEENFTGDDVREGLTVIVSVKLREPQFEGQTKAKLGNPEVRTAVEGVFGENFASFLEEHPQDARAIIAKVVLALKARKAAKAAKESVLRKGVLEGLTLPGKLADCQTRDPEEAELFIVEGDSAGGTAKQGRDRRTQAILPLRGKILNVERARLDKMLAFAEIKALVIALGTAIADEFDLSKIRYHKIIIATDADVDGSHIRTLLLTLFYRYFRPVIEAGYIYAATPPLYKITRSKEVFYAYSDAEKERLVGKEVKEGGGVNIQRYKGLGEMNAGQLWETTMDPKARILKRITIEDAEEADKVFDVLMGAEVEPRKIFIQANAREVQNLDV